MSLEAQVKAIVADEAQAQKLLELINKANPMKKYLATEKGRAAKKRANQKYYHAKGKLIKADKADVEMQITDFCWDIIEKECGHLTDKEVMDPSKFERLRYFTLTELWHDYCQTEGVSQATRKVYATLLPELPLVKSFTRDGKKYYQPAYELDVVKLSKFEVQD